MELDEISHFFLLEHLYLNTSNTKKQFIFFAAIPFQKLTVAELVAKP